MWIGSESQSLFRESSSLGSNEEDSCRDRSYGLVQCGEQCWYGNLGQNVWTSFSPSVDNFNDAQT